MTAVKLFGRQRSELLALVESARACVKATGSFLRTFFWSLRGVLGDGHAHGP